MTLEKEKELSSLKSLILHETKNVASFVVIGETLFKLYYKDKLVKNQKEFLNWTKQNLGFSKSTTYEYIISYRVYSDIVRKLPKNLQPPAYQSHCQLLAKVPEEQLVETWIKVNELAPNGQITTALLENYLQQMNFKPHKKKSASRKKKQEFSSDDESSNDWLEKEERTELPQTPKKRVRSRFPNQSNNDDDNTSKTKTPSSIEVVQTPQRSQRRTQPQIILPFDEEKVYEQAQLVVNGQEFDTVCRGTREFDSLNQEDWAGRIFCDLSSCLPFSKQPLSADGIERFLQIIFTKYANKEYEEGLFLIRAEFGADWFKPIMEQPYVILRHQSGLYEQNSVFHSYVLFYMGPNVNAFVHAFKSSGSIPGYQSWAWQNTLSPNRAPTHQRIESQPKDLDCFNSEFLHVPPNEIQVEDLSKAASALCNMTNE